MASPQDRAGRSTTPDAACRWEHFDHGADIGVRGIAPTLAGAFVQAATALTGVVADVTTVKAEVPVQISCSAPDRELLLADWLNALVFEMATRRMPFSAFTVSIDRHRLNATAWGEAVEPARHLPAVEVKGATYTALRVAPTSDRGWVAECVVDV